MATPRRSRLWWLLVLLSALAPLGAAEAASVPAPPHAPIRASRAKGPMHCDGVLDEPAWATAQPVTEFYQQTPDQGAAITMPADFRVSITNAPGKDAYPIASFTWLLIPVQSKDPAKGKVISDFLNWMVDKGQSMTSQLTYARLPQNVAAKVKEEIKQVK